MAPSLLELTPAVLLATVTWIALRQLVFSHPLDRVPGPKPVSLIKGHLPQLFAGDGWAFHRSLAQSYGRVTRLHGLFRQRILYVYDPKALHHIFVKDQHIYEETTSFIAANKAIFGDSLIATMGPHHKRQRKMLNPVFSIAHMRKMIPIFFSVTYKVRDALLRKTEAGPQEIDMVPWMTRGALEIVGQAALGHSFDTLTEDHTENPYITSMKSLGPLGRPLVIFRQYVVPFFYKHKIGSPRFQRILLSLLPMKSLHKLRDLVDVMHNTSVAIFNARKEAIQSGNVDEEMVDLLSILMKENAKADDKDKLPDSEVTAQISTFMFAGMDTTSNALSRFIWILAKHQDAQDRLRAEIREAKTSFGGEPNYDQLGSLPFLDAFCRETLRLHPPVSTLARQAHKDAVLPLASPIKSTHGTELREIVVPKDTIIVVSIKAANTDPEVWGPDAREWKPERWLSPLPESVAAARIPGVYSHVMTFIGGGRACIGFKFSEMEMKVVLFVLLDLFKFSLGKNDISWNMMGIATPSVGPNEPLSSMPIIVSRAD